MHNLHVIWQSKGYNRARKMLIIEKLVAGGNGASKMGDAATQLVLQASIEDHI